MLNERPVHPGCWRIVAAAALGTCTIAQAATAELGPVVVEASRLPLAASHVAADVIVIDSSDIQNLSADSLEDLLRRRAGLQLSRNGGPGANAGLFIRGASSASTLVLVDGVRIGSATLGLPEIEALGLGDIDRIEVLRGPGASLYGADGAGGVILITTKRAAQGSAASFRGGAGSHGSRVADASFSVAQPSWDLAASLSNEKSDGISAVREGDRFGNYNPDRDGFDRRSVQFKGGIRPSRAHRVQASLFSSRLDSQFDSSEYLPPDFTQNSNVDFRSRQRVVVKSLAWNAGWTEAWTSQVRASRQTSDLVSGGTDKSRFLTLRNQLEGDLTWRFAADQRLMIAAARMDEEAEGEAFGRMLERRNTSVLAAYGGAFDALKLQADVRRDLNSAYGGNNTGRLGAVWSIDDLSRVRFLAGTSFRAPTFNDLYYPSYGVASVRPERTRSVEFGYEAESERDKFSVTAFRSEARDLIAYVGNASECPSATLYPFGCAGNVGRARLEGLSTMAETSGRDWRARIGWELLNARDRSTGQRLARRASNQLSANLDIRTGPLTSFLSMLRVGARPDAGVTLPSYMLLDAGARAPLAGGASVELRILNVADKRYEPVKDYQALGRQAWVILRLEASDLLSGR